MQENHTENRTHKFRAWMTEKCGGVPHMISWERLVELKALDELFESANLGRHILMQFTGLTDKNNSLIYEGDIVEARTLRRIKPKKIYSDWRTFIVYWADWNKAFRLGYPINGIKDDESMANYDEYKILGSIYSDPELLK